VADVFLIVFFPVAVYFDEEKSLMGSFFAIGDFFAAIMGFVLFTFLCFVVGFGLGDDRIVLVYVIQALLYFLYYCNFFV
jgi:hypothetical protein